MTSGLLQRCVKSMPRRTEVASWWPRTLLRFMLGYLPFHLLDSILNKTWWKILQTVFERKVQFFTHYDLDNLVVTVSHRILIYKVALDLSLGESLNTFLPSHRSVSLQTSTLSFYSLSGSAVIFCILGRRTCNYVIDRRGVCGNRSMWLSWRKAC